VPQEPGTNITVNGRDAKLLIAGYDMDGQRLQYSTSELMTHAHIGDRDVLFYGRQGEDGETVLRYAEQPKVTVLAGTVTSTWDASRGDLRLNYTHDGLARVLIDPAGGGTASTAPSPPPRAGLLR
jgi:beta-galactosidase GanA